MWIEIQGKTINTSNVLYFYIKKSMDSTNTYRLKAFKDNEKEIVIYESKNKKECENLLQQINYILSVTTIGGK